MSFFILFKVFKRRGIELAIENFECHEVAKMATPLEWIGLFTEGSLVYGE